MTARGVKAFIFVVALFGYVQAATAELLRWNLQNVTFNDGGTATGFYLMNTTVDGVAPLAGFDIKVTGGAYPSFEYTPPASSGSGAPSFGATFAADLGGQKYRVLALSTSTSPPLESLSGLPARYVVPQPPSHGPLVTWTLDGVRFDNGGTASGSFMFDASTGTVVDFNLHSDEPCTGDGCPGGIAGDINQSFPCVPAGMGEGPACWGVSSEKTNAGTVELVFSNGSHPGSAVLRFDTGRTIDYPSDPAGQPLTAEGGIVPLLSSSQFGCCRERSSYLIAGSLIGTPVPEPSNTLFLALGLAALVGFPVWRRR